MPKFARGRKADHAPITETAIGIVWRQFLDLDATDDPNLDSETAAQALLTAILDMPVRSQRDIAIQARAFLYKHSPVDLDEVAVEWLKQGIRDAGHVLAAIILLIEREIGTPDCPAEWFKCDWMPYQNAPALKPGFPSQAPNGGTAKRRAA